MAYKLQQTTEDVMIAEGACVAGDVTLGRGVNVWYNAVLRGDEGAIVIGEDTSVQDNVIMHGTTTVGKNCTIGHGAIVHGCTVGDNTLIGMGAIVISGAKIGSNCLVGAGALVTGKMDVPDGSMLLGNPAKVVRSLTETDIQALLTDEVQVYRHLNKKYREGRWRGVE